MTFREKTHWLAFFGLAIGFGWYFLAYPWDSAGTKAGMYASLGMLVPVTIIFLIPMIIGTAYFAIRSPKDANVKEDERERLIHMKGTHYAYYPLVLGGWFSIFAIVNGATYGLAINCLMATLVLAELVRIGVQLYFYRRGY